MNSLEVSGLALSPRLYRVRWIMWLFLVSLHLITTFHRVSFNVIADLLTAEFNLTGAGLGNLAAGYTYMYLVMQIPGGMLVDRLGSRGIALVTGLFMACGSLLIGLAPNAAFIFVGRMLIGLGGSVILINILKFQASWFRASEFATLSGFAILLSGSGALLAATPLVLAVNLIGWRGSFLLAGLVTVLVSLLCWFIVRNSPGDLVTTQDGGADSELSAQDVDKSPSPSLITALAVFSNRRIWLPFLINFGTFGGFITFSGTWGVSYLVHVYGLTVEQASTYMAVTYFGYMIGAPLAGAVSDWISSRKLPVLALVLCCVLFWLLLAAWPGGILPLTLLYGLSFLLGFGAACTVLSFSMAREVCPPGYTGSVTAAVNLGVFLGLAILQPLFGYVLDLGWEGLVIDGARIYPLQAYRIGFLVSLVFALTALAAAFLYRDQKLPNSSELPG